MTDDNPHSKHYDEFHARVEAYKQAGGDLPFVWKAVDDLGLQIKDVRHDLIDVKQSNENLDAKLFGWREAARGPVYADGGILGAIDRKIDDVAQRNSLKMDDVVKQTTWALEQQTEQLRSDIRWVMKIGGAIIGLIIAVATAYIIYRVTGHFQIEGKG